MAKQMNTEELRKSLRENVPPDMRGAYDKIIAAGMKFMFDKKTHKFMRDAINSKGDPAIKLGGGVAALLEMIASKAKGAFPGHLIIPAGVELILHAADYAEGVGAFDAEPEVIGQAIQVMTLEIFKKTGMSEDQVLSAIDKLGEMNGKQEQQQSSAGVMP